MKLENQVCPLQQARRLKELGICQDSAFYYHPPYGELLRKGRLVTKTGTQYKKVPVYEDKSSAAAFSVAELGVMIQHIGLYTAVNTVLMGWAVHHVNDYPDYELRQPGNMNSYETEAEARAAILIELIEGGKVSAAEINQRLQNE